MNAVAYFARPFAHLRGLSLALLAATALAGCAAPQPVQPLPEIRFTNQRPINLDVGRIEVASEFQPTFKPPHIEHTMPTAPERVLRQWAEDRLRAAGPADRTARFIIRDASVVEKRLAVDESMKGFFKKEQSERYEGHVEVLIEIRDRNGRVVAETAANTSRSRTVPEDVTLAGRERVWHDITEAMVKELNDLLETNMRQYMGRYIVL